VRVKSLPLHPDNMAVSKNLNVEQKMLRMRNSLTTLKQMASEYMCNVRTLSLTGHGLDHEEDNCYGRSEKRDRLVSVCL